VCGGGGGDGAGAKIAVAPRAFLTPRGSGSSFLRKELRLAAEKFAVVISLILRALLERELPE